MITTIIILILLVLLILVIAFLWIKSLITKSNKKDGTIKQLRKVITEMIELDGDKKDVEIKRKKIKKNIDSMSDDDLSIAYANQLPNMPKKSSRRKPKNS